MIKIGIDIIKPMSDKIISKNVLRNCKKMIDCCILLLLMVFQNALLIYQYHFLKDSILGRKFKIILLSIETLLI